MTGADARLETVAIETASAGEQAEVLALEAAATAYDGVGPLDDQVRLEIAFGAAPEARHLIGRIIGSPGVVGYAHLTHDGEGDASAHLVVDPSQRRLGFGGALLDGLLRLTAEGAPSSRQPPALRVWAHGDTAGAQALAASRGFRRVRELWQMRRPLSLPLPAASYPPDVTVRTFEPGRDDEGWVALNAAAFAGHPEQGRLTLSDLRQRMAQPWFDPDGLFLAERDGTLLGSHWTKVHGVDESGGDESGGDAPIGEVYAVGVHPQAQGLGLGKALTLTGLHHLRDRGLHAVMLYVDGDNAAAVALYRRLGFETTAVDAMYAAPG